MSNRGQLRILGIIMAIFTFVLFWAFYGAYVSTAGEEAVALGQLTGIEAFLVSNLNLWIFVFLIIGSLILIFFGGSE